MLHFVISHRKIFTTDSFALPWIFADDMVFFQHNPSVFYRFHSGFGAVNASALICKVVLLQPWVALLILGEGARAAAVHGLSLRSASRWQWAMFLRRVPTRDIWHYYSSVQNTRRGGEGWRQRDGDLGWRGQRALWTLSSIMSTPGGIPRVKEMGWSWPQARLNKKWNISNSPCYLTGQFDWGTHGPIDSAPVYWPTVRCHLHKRWMALGWCISDHRCIDSSVVM